MKKRLFGIMAAVIILAGAVMPVMPVRAEGEIEQSCVRLWFGEQGSTEPVSELRAGKTYSAHFQFHFLEDVQGLMACAYVGIITGEPYAALRITTSKDEYRYTFPIPINEADSAFQVNLREVSDSGIMHCGGKMDDAILPKEFIGYNPGVIIGYDEPNGTAPAGSDHEFELCFDFEVCMPDYPRAIPTWEIEAEGSEAGGDMGIGIGAETETETETSDYTLYRGMIVAIIACSTCGAGMIMGYMIRGGKNRSKQTDEDDKADTEEPKASH